jgi:hypothetical protein
VKVRVCITWKVVVDGQIYTLDIDTTAEDIRGNTDTLVELLELLVALDTGIRVSRYRLKVLYESLPFLLAHPRVYSDGREVTLS